MRRSSLFRGYIWVILPVIALVAALFFLSRRANKTELRVVEVVIEEEEDIIPMRDSLVIPVVYQNPEFISDFPADIRKQKFIDVLLPAIMIYRHKLGQDREQVLHISKKTNNKINWSKEDSLLINNFFEKYKAEDIHELLNKMIPHPVSLALAQAALESGWGTSRFFKEAKNVYGIWSYNKNEPRIAASIGREGTGVYLKKYDTLMGSIEDYYQLLSRSSAYKDFQNCRVRSNNVFELIWYLKRYSEKRNQYVIMLRNVIVANNLTKYDAYIIHPDYLELPGENVAFFKQK